MITAWTQNCKTQEEKQFLESQIMSSKGTLQRLQELLDQEKDALEIAEISPKIYDAPGWDYRQAHTNGFKSALRMVSRIINLDQGNTNG